MSLLRQRIGRIWRQAEGLYRESGSAWRAAFYLARAVRSKSPLLLLHLAGACEPLLPGRVAEERERRERLRAGGRPLLAVAATGGLGDLIVMARFMRDFGGVAGPFGFDVFCAQPDRARWVFGCVPGFGVARFDTIASGVGDYDARLEINQAVVVAAGSVRRDRLAGNPRLLETLDAIARAAAPLAPYIQHQPLLDNGLCRKAVYSNRSRRDFLHHMAGLPYGGDRLDIALDGGAPARLVPQGRPWVTVHNGFDAKFVVSGGRATKCYPHFAEVVAQLKAARPDLMLVQFGTTTSERLPGVDLDLIGRTTLDEAAALLRGAALHLDNEGGLVHLAACLGTRSLVIFGPTPSDYFGYPGNVNVDPLRCGGCFWIDELWMDRCPRGFAEPECTYSIPPGEVTRRAIAALEAAVVVQV